MARQRDGERLVRAREVLEPLWQECNISGFVGRCWGRKHHSQHPGSNIVLCNGLEVVTLHEENANGPIQIKGYGPTCSGSPLKDKVTRLLKEAGLLD